MGLQYATSIFMYIVSLNCYFQSFFTGIKLAEMKHDQLPDYYTDMSVRDGEMAVSGWDDKNFKLFKLTN